ncbi:MAG: translocation/assembly module TamB domain-containing protein [Tannerella sp.]|nr:translocation/assembly module TamB domain-containing protein [Tannerella sp.]
MAREAGEFLSSQLNVPVKIGKVELVWLNRLVLSDVSLDDRRGERLFEAGHVSAGFKVWPLLRKKCVFTTVRLFNFSLHLHRETSAAPLNLQFILDAFASRDTTAQPPNINLQIHSILFRNGSIRYDVADMPDASRKFDPNHVLMEKLNGQISLDIPDSDSLNIRVRTLSFRERSGFRLEKLSTRLSGNRQGVAFDEFDIRLPETQLQITDARVRFHGADSVASTPADVSVELRLNASGLSLRDFAAFVPALRHFPEKTELSAEVSGFPNDMRVRQLTLKQNSALSFQGEMELKNLLQPETTYLFGRIDRLQVTAARLSEIAGRLTEKPFALSAPLRRLGHIDFAGEISGFTDHLVAYGKLQSDIGSLETDMLIGHRREEHIAFYLKGRVASSELDVSRLFDEGNPWGTVRFSAELDVSYPADSSLAGNILAQVNQMDYRGYRYENILLAGHFGRQEFHGRLEVNDTGGKLRAEGFVRDNGEHSVFQVSARLADVRPDKLHFTGSYDRPQMSLNLSAHFTGNHPDNFVGQIVVDDFSFQTAEKSFRLDTLQIDAVNGEDDRKLTVRSDLLNGEINGRYSFASLAPSLLHTLQTYLPSLPLESREQTAGNAFSLTMTLENTESLADMFRLPFANVEQGQISAQYDNLRHTFRLNAMLPKFRIGKSVFEYGSLGLDNPDGRIRLQAKTTFFHKKGARNTLQLDSEAADDRIGTRLSFESMKEQNSIARATFTTSTLFVTDRDGNGRPSLRTEVTLEPNRIVVRDSVWNMEPASVTVMNGNTTIDNFYISKGEQYLRINGTASVRNPKETILVNLNDIELSHIFDIVNIPALQFGGRATGTVSLNSLYGTPVMNTQLEVQHFSFNQVEQGYLKLFSEWDSDQEGILLMGTIYRNDSTWTDVDGLIFPAGPREGLSLRFAARDIDLAMLHPYVDGFTKVIGGRAYGDIHLFGPFSKLSFEGSAFVREGRIGVDFLNTDYTFSDTVYLTPASIRGKEMAIQDKSGNRGTVSFEVQHTYLKDFTFQADVRAQNLLVYDAPERTNPQIYGMVYSSGNARIQGNEQLVTVDATLQSNPKTNLEFKFMNSSTAGEYDFIRFRDPPAGATPRQTATVVSPANSDGGAEVRVNCLIEVTPDASLGLVMDPVSGDRIRGNGSGDMQIAYDSRTDMLSMHGSYTIRNGNYNFSLQQLIRKDFQIREGSRIDFGGDPMEANLNLQAIYFLTANIEDLDQSLSKETLRTSVPVNCVLNLNGRLQSPAISFDMELPNSSGELARQVKSFIDTEDMMARQIVYLLALNKFYTPDYSMNASRSDEFSAVASSALSAQLSNILNSLTDKVQIGTNIRSRQDDVTNPEVEMLLSSRLLDNRLLFNGNFGYKNSSIQTNAFIGEFDLEYRLTPGGEIRLKAYNHANDLYRYHKAMNRQGAGIMFHKDFSTLSEIFRRRKKTAPATP